MAQHVAVAGGGIIGSTIAWKLARSGYRVTLIDARTLGSEASHAGAGMLAPGGEVTTRSGWGDLCLAGARMYPEFVAELESESGERIDYRRCGGIELALSDEEWTKLGERAIRQEEWGVPSRVMTPDELRAMVPELQTRNVAGARYYFHDGVVDPRDIMRALRKALVRNGVTIREGAAVKEIQPGRPVTVVCAAERITADAAILSAGAWSGEARVPGMAIPRTFPVRGHLLGYRLAGWRLGPIVRHDHTYLLQRRSGVLIAGTTSERAGFNRMLDAAAVSDIRTRAEGLVPGLLRGIEPEAWLGFRPATDTLAPEIGELGGTRIWLAYGHYRNGILMAPETARLVVSGIVASLGTG